MNSAPPKVHPPYLGEVLITDLIAGFRSYQWRLVSIVAVMTGIGVLYSYLATPIYESEIVLMPVADEDAAGGAQALMSQLGGLAAIAGLSGNSSSNSTHEAIAILKSRSFTEGFMKDLDLLPVLYQNDWDAESKTWTKGTGEEVPTYIKAYKLWDREVRTVQSQDDTGLVIIKINWRDPEVAAVWANELVSRLNAHLRNRAAKEAERTIAYLKAQLAKTSILEVEQGIYDLLENELKRLMITNIREEYAFKVIDAAVPSTADDHIRPNRPMIVGLSFFAGLFFSAVYCLALQLKRRIA